MRNTLLRRFVSVSAIVFASLARGRAALAESPSIERSAPTATATVDELHAVQTANSAFAVELYQQLSKENQDKNIFVSPFSISLALTMATEGAVGDTAKQMATVLHLPAAAHSGGNSPAFMAVHRGQAGLAANFAPPEVSAEVRAKVTQLKADLAAAKLDALKLAQTTKVPRIQPHTKVTQIEAQLNALPKNVDPYELRIANALWAEKTHRFKQSFLNALQPTYGAVLFPVDFKNNFEPARSQINGWVEKQTNERMKELVPKGALDEYTRLVITNAVYFFSDWEQPFEPGDTKTEPFTAADGSTTKVPLMHQNRARTAAYLAVNPNGTGYTTPREIPIQMNETHPSLYPADGGFTMLSLPYRGEELSMVWLLPRTATGLKEVEKMLSVEKLSGWFKQLVRRPVQVSVPKLKLEANYALVPTLKSLGMQRAFIDPRDPVGAQFDNMSESQDPNQKLHITNVLHKAFVEVNEKGTEAAAATAVIFAAPNAAPNADRPPQKPFIPVFKANQPFLFLIRDNASGSVLFMGRYLGPT